MWTVLYRFALPRLSQQLLGAKFGSTVLEQHRVLMKEIGFTHSSRKRILAEACDESTDLHTAGVFVWMLLSMTVHVLAGLLALPSVIFAWREVGSMSQLAFYAATWVTLGWSLFAAVDETIRCFFPRWPAPSGLSFRCPCFQWTIMFCCYYPFWFSLMLPMNIVCPSASSYHTVVCAMTLGCGFQYGVRLFGLLETGGKSFRIVSCCGTLAVLPVVLLCRGILFVPAAIDCIKQLHHFNPVQGNILLVTSLLMACFNIGAIMDSISSVMRHLLGRKVHRALHGMRDQRPLQHNHSPSQLDACAGRGSNSKASVGRKLGSKYASKGVIDTQGVASAIEEEMTFGFATTEGRDIDLQMGDDGSFDTRAFRPAASHAPVWPNDDICHQWSSVPLSNRQDSANREMRQCQIHSSNHAPEFQSQIKQSPINHAVEFASDTLKAVNHYKMLGLDAHASNADIKHSFRRLSRKWHPDKNHDDVERAAAIFACIKEAYDCLSDAMQRKRYDDFLRDG